MSFDTIPSSSRTVFAMRDYACRGATYLRFHSSAAIFVIILAKCLYSSLKQPLNLRTYKSPIVKYGSI